MTSTSDTISPSGSGSILAATPAAITLFTKSLAASQKFYETFFGIYPRSRDKDTVVFQQGEMLLILLRDEAVDELIAPSAMAGHGARAVYRLSVADVDRTCAEITSRGLAVLNGPVDRPWGLRTASFQDPSGHIWELAA